MVVCAILHGGTFHYARRSAGQVQISRRSILPMFGCVDNLMAVAYEQSVYLLNLWLVYRAPTPLDMVLNSLAMEFVLKLDDEFKATYFANHPHAVAEVLAVLDV